MTIIELFPWLFAVSVTMFSAASLQERYGLSTAWALSAGLLVGIVSCLSIVFGGKRFIFWLERKKTEKEKSKKDRWI